MLHPACAQLDLAHRREIAREVDEPDTARREGREDEAAIARNAGSRLEAVLASVERGVAARIGHADEPAVEIVGPAVVRTGEGAGVAPFARAEHGAAVPAPVDED